MSKALGIKYDMEHKPTVMVKYVKQNMWLAFSSDSSFTTHLVVDCIVQANMVLSVTNVDIASHREDKQYSFSFLRWQIHLM